MTGSRKSTTDISIIVDSHNGSYSEGGSVSLTVRGIADTTGWLTSELTDNIRRQVV